MGYAKIRIFRGNKKEQVLDNLEEKIDKCPAVELGVPHVTLQCYGCIIHMHNMSIIIYSSIL